MKTIYNVSDECTRIEFIFDKPVNVCAWHTLHVIWEMGDLCPLGIQGKQAYTTINLWKWIAWHLPYRLTWRWRL